jgi:sec-independent protein translocase protein TatA
MGLSVTHILLLLVVAVLLFGRGKLSELMGDVGKGIRSFKKALTEDDTSAVQSTIESSAPRRTVAKTT